MGRLYLKLILFCSVTLLCLQSVTGAKKLIFANLVWRHGDRSYISSYPTDPYKDKNIWKNGLGQLTNIGMKEQFELGRYLRSRYDGLLNSDYRRDEIYVRSTDSDRTLMSAECNMAGLFPPTKSEHWNGSSTMWHPVPVHTVPHNSENLLSYPIQNCPAYDEIMKTISQSQWFIEHERKYKNFYEFIRNKTGSETPYNFRNIWAVEDNLFCLKSHNYTLPDWATPEVLSELEQLSSIDMGLQYTDMDYKYRSSISKMQGGVLLKEIIQNMASCIDGTSNNSVVAYSAHDTTLTALLVSLNAYDWVQPKYASCIMVELYSDDISNYFVEIYYKSTDDCVIPLDLNSYGCDEVCTFQKFIEIAQDLIPEDHDAACGRVKNTNIEHYYRLVVLLICICSSLFTFSIMYLVLRKKKLQQQQQEHKYSKIESEDHSPI